MKHFIYLMAFVLIGTMFTGCQSCQSDNAKQETKDTLLTTA